MELKVSYPRKERFNVNKSGPNANIEHSTARNEKRPDLTAYILTCTFLNNLIGFTSEMLGFFIYSGYNFVVYRAYTKVIY